jgi:lipid II:glycine glycyltransferase (peptidoglycan interpeptide bridge formation enzyme)
MNSQIESSTLFLERASEQLQTREITDFGAWEAFVTSRVEANFLQSWNWGVFQERLGKRVVRLGVYSKTGEVLAVAQGVLERARRGSYLAVAGGPLVAWSNEAAVSALFAGLQQWARVAKCSFIRFRPQALDSVELQNQVQLLGARSAPMHVTADLTLQLDLTLSESELLAQMRKNTRGEIRKAERLGLRVELSSDPERIERFYQIQLEVAEKHHFIPFARNFLREQFATFAAAGQALLISTYQDQELLAEAFVIFYNGEAVYHYGISTEANRKLPGSYLGQWAAIHEAKRRGCKIYNFWGVAPENQLEHRFAGVSLFKRGFGGQEVQYLPAHDIPLSWQYWIVFWFEKLRHHSRKL